MPTFQGKRVSTYWKVVLDAAWEDGVRFQLNSGQRTMAEQRALVAEKGLWSPSNPQGAAAPSAHAPHIREGRQDHALDVDTFAQGGGESKLQRWLEKQGAMVRNTVPGEPWHMEVSAGSLARLYRKFSDPLRGYPADERRWIREYDALKRANSKRARRAVLRIVMAARRRSIYRAAQKTGWNKLRRRERYASLKARTK